MDHRTYKMLFERDTDGGVTYTKEDMEIIAQEDKAERNMLIQQIGEIAYDELLADIDNRILGVAQFADDDKESAVHIRYGDVELELFKSAIMKYVVLVSLWGEKLNDIQIYKKGEIVGKWICSEAGSHRFSFQLTQKVIE